jgi:hypothetical protein
MAITVHEPDVKVREVSNEEGRALFDRAARFYLHLSGEEFLMAWNEGKFQDPDQPEIMAVAVLLPFAR